MKPKGARSLEHDETIRGLLQELAESDKGLLALVLELEERLECREAELRAVHEELERTNSEVLQSTLELQAAYKELESFSYSVSHDLRAPLRAIDGFSSFLADGYEFEMDETARGYLKRIREGCQRMNQLIEDLLSLSRIGRREMRINPVNLSVMARDVITVLKAAEPYREVEFVVYDDVIAAGDPGLVKIVLENLIGNAWKFTGKNPSARIEFGSLPDRAVFFVKDNGAGFDMKNAQRLFGVFQRLHHQRDFPGTGIGLATVQRIVRRHGGNIWAEAAIDEGAAFYFTLSLR